MKWQNGPALHSHAAYVSPGSPLGIRMLVLLLVCLLYNQAAHGQQRKSSDVLMRVQYTSDAQNCTNLNEGLLDLADSVGVDLSRRPMQCSQTNGNTYQQIFLLNSSDVVLSLASLDADWPTFTQDALVPCGTALRVSAQTSLDPTPLVYIFSCDSNASTENITRLAQHYNLSTLCCSPPPAAPPPTSPLAPPSPSPAPPPPKPRIRKRSAPVEVPQLVIDIFAEPARLDCSALVAALTTISLPYGLDGGIINCTLVTPRVHDPVAALNPFGGVSAQFLSVTGAWSARLYNRIMTRMQQTLGASIDAFVTLGPIPCGTMLRGTLRDSSALLRATQVFTCSIMDSTGSPVTSPVDNEDGSNPSPFSTGGMGSSVTQTQADALRNLGFSVITRRTLCCRAPPPLINNGGSSSPQPPLLPSPPQLPSQPDLPPTTQSTPVPASPSLVLPPAEAAEAAAPPSSSTTSQPSPPSALQAFGEVPSSSVNSATSPQSSPFSSASIAVVSSLAGAVLVLVLVVVSVYMVRSRRAKRLAAEQAGAHKQLSKGGSNGQDRQGCTSKSESAASKLSDVHRKLLSAGPSATLTANDSAEWQVNVLQSGTGFANPAPLLDSLHMEARGEVAERLTRTLAEQQEYDPRTRSITLARNSMGLGRAHGTLARESRPLSELLQDLVPVSEVLPMFDRSSGRHSHSAFPSHLARTSDGMNQMNVFRCAMAMVSLSDVADSGPNSEALSHASFVPALSPAPSAWVPNGNTGMGMPYGAGPMGSVGYMHGQASMHQLSATHGGSTVVGLLDLFQPPKQQAQEVGDGKLAVSMLSAWPSGVPRADPARALDLGSAAHVVGAPQEPSVAGIGAAAGVSRTLSPSYEPGKHASMPADSASGPSTLGVSNEGSASGMAANTNAMDVSSADVSLGSGALGSGTTSDSGKDLAMLEHRQVFRPATTVGGVVELSNMPAYDCCASKSGSRGRASTSDEGSPCGAFQVSEQSVVAVTCTWGHTQPTAVTAMAQHPSHEHAPLQSNTQPPVLSPSYVGLQPLPTIPSRHSARRLLTQQGADPMLLQQQQQQLLLPLGSPGPSPAGSTRPSLSLSRQGTSVSCAGASASTGAELELDPREVQILTDGLLGQGAFGMVYTGLYHGQAVAIKVLNHLQLGSGMLLHQKDVVSFRHELALLSRLTHPNIVRVLGGCAHYSHPFLVMELMPGCLHGFIHGAAAPLSLRQVLQVARDVAAGLAYLHPSIVHRDLKPANILLDEDGTAKISDFGLARCKLKPYISTQQPDAGSVAYMAPECFDPAIGRLSSKCDVYSFGVLLWEMVTQEHPWAGDSNVAIIYKVAVHRMHPSIPGAAAGCPAELAELMADCMAYQPQDRPDMQQVLIQLEALLALFAGLQTAA